MAGPQDMPPADESRRIGRAAARWLVLQDRGLTAAEQDEFFDWLAADPRHGEWLERQRATWQSLDKLVMWCPEHSAEPNPDLLSQTLASRRRLRRWRWFGSLALAAAGAAVLISVWPIVPGTAPAAAAPPPVEWIAQGFERRQLEDGSMVELTGGTRLWLEYTSPERPLRLLEGEAHFTVAKNPARPFVVSVSGVDLRALGTAFNVQLDRRQVEVVVTHGRVQVLRAAGFGTGADALAKVLGALGKAEVHAVLLVCRWGQRAALSVFAVGIGVGATGCDSLPWPDPSSWPSISVPSDGLMFEMWMNRSSPPASGWIKPKPLASLKNFTVPVYINNKL